MKKILVTGGFGFIGTTLVERLMRSDDEVHVHIIDDLSSSPVSIPDYMDRLYKGNIFSQCTFDIVSVRDYFTINLPDSEQFPYDEIYHLASPVGPASVIKQGGKMVGEVVRDIHLIIDYCVKHGAKLLDVSTSEVYGGGDKDGLCSEDTPKIFQPKVNMRMEYAVAKFAAEISIMNSCKVSGLNAVIIRPFNVAGPRQSVFGGFVVPRFVQQACNDLPYTIFGDGTDIRSFTHVKDIADGMILAMYAGESGAVYNLGNPHNKTNITDLAHLINSVLGVDNKLSYIDPKTIYGDFYEKAHDKYPDSTKAMSELGWTPTLSTKQIIKDYYTEYKRQLSVGVLIQSVTDDDDKDV